MGVELNLDPFDDDSGGTASAAAGTVSAATSSERARIRPNQTPRNLGRCAALQRAVHAASLYWLGSRSVGTDAPSYSERTGTLE